VTTAQDTLTSAVPDTGDVPLDTPLEVDDAEHARILHRTGPGEGEPSVSAFNSSI
jgi:hypothetical protein